MPEFLAKTALLPQGWADQVLISVDDAGWISAIRPLGQSAPPPTMQVLDGPVIPGMPNVHSHAFQYAMAGLAEHSDHPTNSFWTWRKIMYEFLDWLEAPELEQIATDLYRAMLRAGYTQVAEFHYVHHRPDGTPYDDRNHLAHTMIRAAKAAGIGITMIPVLYAYSGFGGLPPEHGQRRFINTQKQILDMVAALHTDYAGDDMVKIGVSLHSLRAVSPEMIRETVDEARRINPQIPIHIHAAEQEKEVEDCKAWSGKRPVEWLLDNHAVDSHWCLIHSTHMTEEETRGLAHSGAVAGLCPTTEGNLGDGIFNLPSYLDHGGRFGIGTDSHISINMIEELRWLEYAQRLTRRQRLIARSAHEQNVGAYLYKSALLGGAQALGTKTGQLSPGYRADFIVLDDEQGRFRDRAGDMILDAAIFASNSNPVRDVFVGGRQVVKDKKAGL